MIGADFGDWHIGCLPEDGGRISLLEYRGRGLLTTNPSSFRKPEFNYGDYELRPVYGYDDCFPTVDKCIYPTGKFECSDHGELYRQRWLVRKEQDSLLCSALCPRPEIRFTRQLEFAERSIRWKFKIENKTGEKLPFIHVMHALMPLQNIVKMELPSFGKIFDEISFVNLGWEDPSEVNNRLMSMGEGKFIMLILNGVNSGNVVLHMKDGVILHIEYDAAVFPSLGIWWNNKGYPDEDGLRRSECAFEPIPGTSSSLERSFIEGTFLSVDANTNYNWEIIWNINLK